MLIAGNWKMNCSIKSATELIKNIKNFIQNDKSVELAVFPPFILIPTVYKLLIKTKIILGAQDCSDKSVGAFTGQISAEMLKNHGCSMVILGHSERRTLISESSSLVKDKCIQALKNNLNPIICIGEKLKDRENGNYLKILEMQLSESLPDNKSTSFLGKIVIAYEPIWAIGTGKVASEENILETHNFIRSFLESNKPHLKKSQILYGGSVKPENARKIMNIQNVNGVLVGGSSLNSNDFIKIAENSILKN